MSPGSLIEMSKIMEVQQPLMPLGLDDQEMREPVQAPRWFVIPCSSPLEKFSGCGVINISGANSGFPYASLSPVKFAQISQQSPEEDEGEWLKKVGDYKEREMCYESGGGGRSGFGPFPWIFSKPVFSEEFKMHCKSGEVAGILDRFLDHKGNDHVVHIRGDPDVNNANGFVSHGYKKPQAARFIAKAGAVAGAWGTILGMATYLPQEIQWIAAVAAAIPTLAVIFA